MALQEFEWVAKQTIKAGLATTGTAFEQSAPGVCAAVKPMKCHVVTALFLIGEVLAAKAVGAVNQDDSGLPPPPGPLIPRRDPLESLKTR